MEQYTAHNMWMVDRLTCLSEVLALLDADGKISMFHLEDGVYTPCKDFHFFDTEQEARKWRKEYIETLYAKMKQCKDLIEELDCLYPTYDFPFDKKDYLGPYADRQDYKSEYILYKNICQILSVALTAKMLNIRGRSIPLTEITKINWHDKEKATLVLKDGSVTTDSEAEYDAIQMIFGANHSGRVIVENTK